MKKTAENLAKAFIGESMARNRYDMYSKIAKKEGYVQIAEIFRQTADQEREHAKWLFRMIQDVGGKENLEVSSDVPTVLGDTAQNLKAAIEGESYEHGTMYPEFAAVAEQECLPDIAARLRAIAKAELHHEQRYRSLLDNVNAKTVLKKDGDTQWACSKCGYLHDGGSPPEKCPACGHPPEYFIIRCEAY